MKVNLTKFDPKKDIQKVDQFGYVNLNKAFENGYVEGNVDVNETDYNDIENPASIIGKPSDAFEAMRMQDALVSGVKSANAVSAKKSSEKDEN